MRRRSAATPPAIESLESRLLLSAFPAVPVPAKPGRGNDFRGIGNDGGLAPPDYLPPEPKFQPVATDGDALVPVAAPLDQTFLLHSLPGADLVIYLDFDGHTTSGTPWNSSFNGGAAIVSPAYNLDGNPSSFSTAELEQIQRIWERVIEDFAPFNVDVTTEDPGVERLRKSGSSDTQWGIRVVITPDRSWYGNAGGVAYINSFSWNSDTPAFVFNSGEVGVAEAISHEVGHTLGLMHDGTGSVDYYEGHGSGATGWAPLMGVGYYRSLTQWSKGEYPGASTLQDDLAVMTSTNTGLTYRADDHGNTSSSATMLTVNGANLSGAGLIERNTDADMFWFDSAGGAFNFTINPWHRSPNLDILAELYDAAGNLIASSNPVTALNATISATLAAGRYFLRIDGTGKPASGSDYGYSDYGSLGQYTISGSMTLLPPEVSIAVSPASVTEDGSGELRYTFTRTGDASSSLTVNFSVAGTATFGTDYSQTGAASFGANSGTITFAAGSSTAVLRIIPTDDVEVEPDESLVITVLSSANYLLGSQTVAAGSILNDDSIPAPTVVSVRYGYGTGSWMEAENLTDRTAPWRITSIEITFDRDVLIDMNDLVVTGMLSGLVSFSNFTYDPLTFVATWTLATPIDRDRLSLTLEGDASSNDGARAASGAETSAAPLPAGIFDSDLDILYGDVSGDGVVDLLDALLQRTRNTTSDAWADTSGDGTVDLLDALLLRTNNGDTLPS